MSLRSCGLHVLMQTPGNQFLLSLNGADFHVV
jgi:hypothetical protein